MFLLQNQINKKNSYLCSPPRSKIQAWHQVSVVATIYLLLLLLSLLPSTFYSTRASPFPSTFYNIFSFSCSNIFSFSCSTRHHKHTGPANKINKMLLYIYLMCRHSQHQHKKNICFNLNNLNTFTKETGSRNVKLVFF